MFDNGDDGVDAVDTNATITNSISLNNVGLDFDIVTASQSYNVSSDGTAGGVGSIPTAGWTDNPNPSAGDWVVFADLSSEDFHLQPVAGNDALDGGNDLSVAFGSDLDGEPRPGGLAWDVGADEFAGDALLLSDHPIGQTADRFTTTSPFTGELFGFRLRRYGLVTIDNLRLQLGGAGVVDSDLVVGELWRDANADGVIGPGDSQIEGGVSGASGQLTFTSNFTPSLAGTSYLIRATVLNLQADDSLTLSLGVGDIDPIEAGVVESGFITSALHTQDRSLVLSDHDAGQTPDKFDGTTPITDVLFAFALTRYGGVTVSQLRVGFTTTQGVADGDVSGGELWIDGNGNGIIDGGDVLVQGGVFPIGRVLAFTSAFTPDLTGTRLLIRATVANLTPGDATSFTLGTGDVDVLEAGVWKLGSVTGAGHVQEALSPVSIYYSVGTNGGDLEAGSPTIDISGGIATFSQPQPDTVGLGDVITYNGSDQAYIAGRTSSTVYAATTVTGGVPPDRVGAGVSSIRRVFNSLGQAESNSSGVSYLNTSDLVGSNFQLNWVCYNDGPMDEREIVIDGYTTGADHYIRIFTPTGPNEVGISQRHTGVAGTGFRLLRIEDLSATLLFQYFHVLEEYVRIEGLELDGSGLANGRRLYGVRVGAGVSPTSDLRFDEMIVHHLTNSASFPADDSDIQAFRFENGSAKLTNGILYHLDQVNTNAGSAVEAILFTGTNAGNNLLYNNSVFNVKNVNAMHARGIDVLAGAVTATNNVVLDVESNAGTEACFNGPISQSHNVSSDGTAGGAGSQINHTDYSSYFVSISDGGEDLHLQGDSNALWGGYGADLDQDPDLAITDDIDGDPRDCCLPDIGADEFGGGSPTLTLAEHATGQVSDRFGAISPLTDVLFAFQLTRTGMVTVDRLRLRFTTGSGVADGDVTNGELWLDANQDGLIDGGDSLIEGGVAPLAGVVEFTADFSPGVFGSHYLLRASVDNLVGDDQTSLSLDLTDIDELSGVSESGAVTTALHRQDPTLTLSEHDAGQIPDQFTTPGSLSGAVLFRFKLERNGSLDVQELRVRFIDDSGVGDGDLGNATLWLDADADGTVSAGDSPILSGVSPSGGVLRFTAVFSPGVLGTNYLVEADVANLLGCDATRIWLTSSDIDELPSPVLESGSVATGDHAQDLCTQVEVFTATSTDRQNLLQWVNPQGAFEAIRIVGRSDFPPTDPEDPGAPLLIDSFGSPGTKDSFLHGSLTNDLTYHYALFVKVGGVYSTPMRVKGRPFDSISGPIRWAYSTGATALVPPGLGFRKGLPFVYAVSNDSILHSMNGDALGGDWPGPWKPFKLPQPAQERPPSIGFPVGSAADGAVFVGSEDGNVYAIDAEVGTEEWVSGETDERILASPAAMFNVPPYPGPYNLILVGTRNSSSPSRFLALDVDTGATRWVFDNGGAPNDLGIISSGALVDYGNSRVCFASRSGGSPDTVWCLDFDGASAVLHNSWDVGNVDGSLTLHNGILYVGGNDAQLYAIDPDVVTPLWSYPTGDGKVKSFVFPQLLTDNLVFSTDTKVTSLDPNGGFPIANWTTPMPAPSNPSTPLFVPLTDKVIVGNGDGRLYQIDVDDGSILTSVRLGAGTGAVGIPSLNVFDDLIYVGTEEGVIYAVEFPLP